jgi:hypothetical protein
VYGNKETVLFLERLLASQLDSHHAVKSIVATTVAHSRETIATFASSLINIQPTVRGPPPEAKPSQARDDNGSQIGHFVASSAHDLFNTRRCQQAVLSLDSERLSRKREALIDIDS